MRGARKWSVQIFVGEADGRTYAEAALCDDVGNRVRGSGHVRPNLADNDVAETGDEIAVARALHDLSRRLLKVVDDVDALTYEPSSSLDESPPSMRDVWPSINRQGAAVEP
jgi:Domain of unknown function (DUF1876)